MYKNHQITVGMIFMNTDNYRIFLNSVKSILKNRLFNIHLIIIDNTGEDFFEQTEDVDFLTKIRVSKTKEPLMLQFREYITLNDRIEILKNVEVQSVAANWNMIYEKSCSPVVIFCNDDILVNQYYDKLIYDKIFGEERYNEIPVAVCSFPEAYPHKKLVEHSWNYDNCRKEYAAPVGVIPIIEGFNGACFGVRRSILEEVARRQPHDKPFDERYRLACYEDLDFYKVVTNLDYRFELLYSSFIFHYGASTRNSSMMDDLQKKHTNGEYHIDYNRKEFLKKWDMGAAELEGFEAGFYKGWNDPARNHPVWHKAQDLLNEEKEKV